MPSATSSYTIVKSNIEDKDDSHVSISYADMRSTSTMIWESDDKTGKLDFVVNGNEIKCTFSNLTLQPSMMYNKGEQDGTATISGNLIIFSKVLCLSSLVPLSFSSFLSGRIKAHFVCGGKLRRILFTIVKQPYLRSKGGFIKTFVM